jgi:hypothetical protein
MGKPAPLLSNVSVAPASSVMRTVKLEILVVASRRAVKE